MKDIINYTQILCEITSLFQNQLIVGGAKHVLLVALHDKVEQHSQ